MHHTHPEIILRLKRAGGHLQKIIQMMEKDEPCLDTAQQMQAVVSALVAAKRTFVQDHIEHCLDASILNDPNAAQQHLKEFKEITKYL
jgi:DNA-binding FrmR family transcriptional regulator